jgi:polysaccharide biosynthesis protein PslG
VWSASFLLALVLMLSSLLAPSAGYAGEQAVASEDAPAAAPTDPRLFLQTGFRVDRDAFWDYFTHRGGVEVFGYPASRDFQFMGCQVQFFQRLVMQQCKGQGVGTLNLLDDGLLPYTRMNGSTFPAPDATLKARTPRVTDANYGSAMLDFVRRTAVDTFDGRPVNFGKTFFNTLTPEMANTSDPAILGLLALEIWGAPTSPPAYDPTNRNFIYQRFQRGIMHYDAGCGCTRGLLLADYLKSLITGENLPSDLADQAGASPLFHAATDGRLPDATLFGNAFIQGAGSATVSDLSLKSVPMGANLPPVLPSPDFGLSMFLWNQPSTTTRDLGVARTLGFTWQKTLFQWSQIEGKAKGVYDWSESDRLVAASARAGIRIVGRIDFQPGWARKDRAHNGPPDNYQDYADFVNAFVSRYKTGSPIGTVDAIEVWNEVNLTREWGNQPINKQQAADYVRLLTAAYKAAHTADANIIVISAGLSPTGVHTAQAWDDLEYLQWLFDAGLRGGVNYDVLGAHGNTQAPQVDAPLNSLPGFNHPSFYFRRIEQLREAQVKAGDGRRQIWLLEFGWTADKIHPSYSWFAVSEEQKAANIVGALRYAKEHWRPWIGVMSVWTLSDPTWDSQREEYWWAINNPDGTPRPALTALLKARADGAF